MDILLIAVTGLSLAMALVMAGLVLRLTREERRRSDARVASLIEMASEDAQGARAPVPASVPARDAPRTDARLPLATPGLSRATALRHPAADAPHADGEIDLELRSASPKATSAVGNLFNPPVRTSPLAARLAVAAGLAVVVALAGYLLLSSGSGVGPATGTRAAAPAVHAAPLELLSLRHTQQGSGLAVTGLVLNPRTGGTLTRVIATAMAFAADGTFLASGRAQLDFTSLAPGAESPFVVQVPVTGTVARYRIGFRTEDGGVIAHIDRRTAEAVARK